MSRRHAGSLTVKEQQVADAMAAGLTDAEITEKLKISLNTLKYHRSMIRATLLGNAAIEAEQASPSK